MRTTLAWRPDASTYGFIKVGKASNLASRERGYGKVFGTDNVRFRRLALLANTRNAERCLLRALDAWGQRAPSGRRTEWLFGISAERAAELARACLIDAGFEFRWMWTAYQHPVQGTDHAATQSSASARPELASV